MEDDTHAGLIGFGVFAAPMVGAKPRYATRDLGPLVRIRLRSPERGDELD